MGLAIPDICVGTMVDHSWEKREDGKILARDTRRRGIIVKIDGSDDCVSGIWVKFSAQGKAEKVPGAELDKAFAARSTTARRALRMVLGTPKNVGAEFPAKKAHRRVKVVDALGITPKAGPAVVMPEYDEDAESEVVGGMELEDKG